MWPLLLSSLTALTIVIERLMFWWREDRKRGTLSLEQLFNWVEEADYDAPAGLDRSKVFASARILLVGLSHREHGLAEGIEVAAGREIARMKQGLGILDTIITMAPLLGILGTVLGIMDSFSIFGSSEIADPQVLRGIAQALITTATGLAVALVTLVLYNYLCSRVEKTARELEQVATQFQIVYKKGSGK